MKPTTIILIVLYLVIFMLGGWWFYNKYFHGIISPNTNTQTVNLTQAHGIYYTIGNNLYQLNAANLNKSSQDIATFRLQSTGEVQSINLDPNNDFFVYDVITSQGDSEIWQVFYKDNHSEKLFSKITSGLENYKNFRSPKMSKIGRNLAFVATNQNSDDIFILNITDNSLANITSGSVKSKITAINWSETEDNIYFSTFDGTNSVINSIDLKKNSTTLFNGQDKITRIEPLSDKIIVSYDDANSIENLGFLLLPKLDKLNPITDLQTPKTVKNFDISTDGKQIVYQVQLESSGVKTNDIYIVNTDSTNLLQLTINGKSQAPVFSPENNKIAYYLTESGIYTMDTLKTNNQKILNETNLINKLLIWK